MIKKEKRTWEVGWRKTIYDLKTGGLVDVYEEEEPAVFETEKEARTCFATKKASFRIAGRRLVVEDYFLRSTRIRDDDFDVDSTEVDSTDWPGRILDLLRGLAKFDEWSLTDEAQDSLDYQFWKDTSSWQPVEGFLSFVKETIQ